MSKQKRVIFLVVFAVPFVTLLAFKIFYNFPYALPVGALLAIALSVIYYYLFKVPYPSAERRARPTRIAIRLYAGFALVALVSIGTDGWQWYDLLFLVFPTVFSLLLFRSSHKLQQNEFE